MAVGGTLICKLKKMESENNSGLAKTIIAVEGDRLLVLAHSVDYSCTSMLNRRASLQLPRGSVCGHF